MDSSASPTTVAADVDVILPCRGGSPGHSPTTYFCTVCYEPCDQWSLLTGVHAGHHALPHEEAMVYLPSALLKEARDSLSQWEEAHAKPMRSQRLQLDTNLCYLLEAREQKLAALDALMKEVSDVEQQITTAAEATAVACCNWRYQRERMEKCVQRWQRGGKALERLIVGTVDPSRSQSRPQGRQGPPQLPSAQQMAERHLAHTAVSELRQLNKLLHTQLQSWEADQLASEAQVRAAARTHTATATAAVGRTPAPEPEASIGRGTEGEPHPHSSSATVGATSTVSTRSHCDAATAATVAISQRSTGGLQEPTERSPSSQGVVQGMPARLAVPAPRSPASLPLLSSARGHAAAVSQSECVTLRLLMQQRLSDVRRVPSKPHTHPPPVAVTATAAATGTSFSTDTRPSTMSGGRDGLTPTMTSISDDTDSSSRESRWAAIHSRQLELRDALDALEGCYAMESCPSRRPRRSPTSHRSEDSSEGTTVSELQHALMNSLGV